MFFCLKRFVKRLGQQKFKNQMRVFLDIIILLFIQMEKPNHKKISLKEQRDQNRLTTAPVRQRPKYTDLYKTSNFQLPVLKGKTYIGREPVVVSRDVKRNNAKKQQYPKVQHEVHENHKRPQTSKGSRNCNKHESQYYEDEQDDLIVTSMHQRIENLKKINQKLNFQHSCAKNQ